MASGTGALVLNGFVSNLCMLSRSIRVASLC